MICKEYKKAKGKKLKPKVLKSGLMVCPLCNEKLSGKIVFVKPKNKSLDEEI